MTKLTHARFNVLFWIVWNIPLGRLAPYVLGVALGRSPKKAKGSRSDEQ